MIKRLMVISGSLGLVACATVPAEKEASHILPSYSEKTGTVRADQLSGDVSCPRELGYEKPDWKYLVQAANACVKAKEWERVEKLGDALSLRASLTPWGAYFLSLAADARNDQPRAVWMIDLALKKAPNEGLFHYQKGRLHWKSGETDLAVEDLKEASRLNPSLTEAHYMMGQVLLQSDDLREAYGYLIKALKNDPKHQGALLAAATVQLKRKNYEDAEAFLAEAVEIYPRLTQARLVLAEVQEVHLQKSTDALQSYRNIKRLAAEHKLDQLVTVNIDEKIQALEKKMAQMGPHGYSLERRPTAERRAKK